MLAQDFEFEFAPGDSAGAAAPNPWRVSDEMMFATHLFRDGTASQQGPSSISVEMGSTPTDEPDPRPGKNPQWHRLVTAIPKVTIYFPDGGYYLDGPQRFYVVRGDSARLSPQLIAWGFKPDPGRWWIERWAEVSPRSVSTAGPARTPSSPNRTQATDWFTWGWLRAMYH